MTLKLRYLINGIVIYLIVEVGRDLKSFRSKKFLDEFVDFAERELEDGLAGEWGEEMEACGVLVQFFAV